MEMENSKPEETVQVPESVTAPVTSAPEVKPVPMMAPAPVPAVAAVPAVKAAPAAIVPAGPMVLPKTTGQTVGGWNRFAGYNPNAAKNKPKDGRGGPGRK